MKPQSSQDVLYNRPKVNGNCREKNFAGDFDKSRSEMMGGFGSGGWNSTGRATVEQRRSIAIGELNRVGALHRGWISSLAWACGGERVADILLCGGRESIRLLGRARVDREWRPIDEPVPVLWRPCPFGGERPFFACPECGQAVLAIYGCGARFLCRICCR